MDSAAGEFPSGRLWSLWDIMFNFNFLEAHAALQLVTMRHEECLQRAVESRKTVVVEWVDDANRKDAHRVLAHCYQAFGSLKSRSINDRIFRFRAALEKAISWEDIASEFRVLREAIFDEMKHHYFYHYPPQSAQIVKEFEEKWAAAISGFPEIRDDAFSAVDCVALGHHTASVFHSMRVVEHGLRHLAAAVNLTFDVQQWQTIIEQIESEIRDLGNRWPKTASKSDWMQFFSSAAKEFFHFKDGWRNYVSHNLHPYDEPQARSVLEHTRTFMNHLAVRMGE